MGRFTQSFTIQRLANTLARTFPRNKTMTDSHQYISVDVESCPPTSYTSAGDAIDSSRTLNASSSLIEIQECCRSQILNKFWWTGDRCGFCLENASLCLSSESTRLILAKMDGNCSEVPTFQSENVYRLLFSRVNLESEWCPKSEIAPCLGRKLTRIEKTDFGYVIKFNGVRPLLFTVLRVLKAGAVLPASLIHFSVAE